MSTFGQRGDNSVSIWSKRVRGTLFALHKSYEIRVLCDGDRRVANKLILESLSLKPQCAEFVAQIETERNIAKPAKPAALVEALC